MANSSCCNRTDCNCSGYTEMENIQLVIAELLSDEPTVRMIDKGSKCNSPVSEMYVNLIRKELYSIDKVPERYVEEVAMILKREE